MARIEAANPAGGLGAVSEGLSRPPGEAGKPDPSEDAAGPGDGALAARLTPGLPSGAKWLGEVSPNWNLMAEIETLRGRYSSDPLAERFGSSPEGTYARVMVDDDVAAVVFNGGGVSIASEYADRVGDMPQDGHGPDLAAQRADHIARALGGTVEQAETALTQEDFDAGVRPGMNAVDTEAMKRDGVYDAWNSLTTIYNRWQSAKALMAAAEMKPDLEPPDRLDPFRVSGAYRPWGR